MIAFSITLHCLLITLPIQLHHSFIRAQWHPWIQVKIQCLLVQSVGSKGRARVGFLSSRSLLYIHIHTSTECLESWESVVSWLVAFDQLDSASSSILMPLALQWSQFYLILALWPLYFTHLTIIDQHPSVTHPFGYLLTGCSIVRFAICAS